MRTCKRVVGAAAAAAAAARAAAAAQGPCPCSPARSASASRRTCSSAHSSVFALVCAGVLGGAMGICRCVPLCCCAVAAHPTRNADVLLLLLLLLCGCPVVSPGPGPLLMRPHNQGPIRPSAAWITTNLLNSNDWSVTVAAAVQVVTQS
jgi:hypothetical protein